MTKFLNFFERKLHFDQYNFLWKLWIFLANFYELSIFDQNFWENFLRKNFLFWRKFQFLPEFPLLTKIFIFWEIILFFTKISIFDQNFHLWRKFPFWPNFLFFFQNFNYWQKISVFKWSFQFFKKTFDFWPKISF